MLFAAGILGFVFVGELEDSVRSSLEKSLKENYGVPGKESITDSWNSVQQNVSTLKDLNTLEFYFNMPMQNMQYTAFLLLLKRLIW